MNMTQLYGPDFTTGNPFREAKKFLWSGTGSLDGAEGFICHAIARAKQLGRISPAQAFAATRIVESRLPEGCTVHCYLQRIGIDNQLLNTVNVQAFRRRWLNHLARQWEEGIRR
jgi:hypothetical protein